MLATWHLSETWQAMKANPLRLRPANFKSAPTSSIAILCWLVGIVIIVMSVVIEAHIGLAVAAFFVCLGWGFFAISRGRVYLELTVDGIIEHFALHRRSWHWK